MSASEILSALMDSASEATISASLQATQPPSSATQSTQSAASSAIR